LRKSRRLKEGVLMIFLREVVLQGVNFSRPRTPPGGMAENASGRCAEAISLAG
jgi:hypothetical protein